MKTKLFLTCMLCMPLLGFSQTGFKKFYGSGSTYQTLNAILSFEDGFLLGGSDGATPSNGTDFWLLMTDSLGNEIWTSHYGTWRNENLTHLERTPDNGFLLAGTQEHHGKQNGYLIKLDEQFNEVWNLRLNEDLNSFILKDMFIDQHGNILIACTEKHVDESQSGLYKINGEGMIEWVARPGIVDIAIGASPAGNGHYFLYGYQNLLLLKKAMIAKIDTGGSIVWIKEYRDELHNTIMTFVMGDRLQQSGGHLLSSSNLLTKIKLDGTIEWQTNLNNPIWYNTQVVDRGDDSFFLIGGNAVHIIKFNDQQLEESYHTFPELTLSHTFKDVVVMPDDRLAICGSITNDDNGVDGFLLILADSITYGWHSVYGDQDIDHTERGNDCIQTSDRGFVMLGEGRILYPERDYYIVKTDSVGNIVWELNYGPVFNAEPSSIIESSDNHILISGKSDSSTSIDEELILLKLDQQGNTIWERKYMFGNLRKTIRLIAQPDGHALVCFSNGSDNSPPKPTLMEINSEGDILWTKSISNTTVYNHIFNAYITVSNDILLVGRTSLIDGGWVARVDPNGDLIYSADLVTHNSGINPLFSAVEAPNEEILAPLANPKINGDTDSIFLFRIGNTGNIVTRSLISTSYKDVSRLNINATTGNEYLLSFMSGSEYWYILRIDEQGNILQTTEHKAAYFQSIEKTGIAHDQGLVVFGSAINRNSRDFYLVKTGPDGVLPNRSVRYDENFLLFPNPVPSLLTVSCYSDYQGPVELTITGTGGQTVLERTGYKMSDTFERSYSVDHLPSGIYFIRFAESRRIHSGTFFKQ